METVSIPLPTALRAFVDSQLGDGRYDSVGAYVRALIEADERRKATEKLGAMLFDELASAETPWTREDVDEIRATAADR